MNTLNELKQQPLWAFAIEKLGYKPVRGKDSRTWRCLESPKGHKILTKSTPNDLGHYLYKSVDGEGAGSLVDLLINTHGLSIQDVIHGYSSLPPLSTKNPQPPKTRFLSKSEVCAHLSRYSSRTSNNYLTSRGVSKPIQQKFNVRSNGSGAIFPLFELKNKSWSTVCLWERRRCDKFPRLFKGAKGAAVSLMGDKSKYTCAAVFESPIDALSYYQLFSPKNTLLISLCGTPSLAQKQGLYAKIKHFGIKKVQVCFDNDEAGERQHKDLLTYLRSFEAIRLKPQKKDWCEDLNKRFF